ncbi:immunoglobulin i-set domain-containing protein [Phthorimaea operculella]|nr:immunoglobulin i-set domain-containing protein [Phthorimaea operculella]
MAFMGRPPYQQEWDPYTGPTRRDPVLYGSVLSEVLQRFWESEEPPTADRRKPEDDECELFYQYNTARCPSGRFVTRLPFLPNRPALVWRHVPGEWNPADCASRGCRAPDLVSHPLWWGPQWLTESPQEWPFNECRAPLGPPDRGWIKRFVNNCRKPQAERNFTPVLSPAERNAALCSLVRVVQAEHFEEEVRLLRDGPMEKQFDVHPKDATARAGQPFILSCSISSAPPATVSWLRDELPLPHDDRYHIIQNQLLITDVTSADEGSYRCIATNPQLSKSRTSNPGRLTVQFGAGDQDAAFLPINHESHFTALRGSRVVLPCPVTGQPRPKLIWEFTPPGERKSELDVVDEVFVIRSLQPDQEGNYSCQRHLLEALDILVIRSMQTYQEDNYSYQVEGNSELVKTFTVTLTEPAKITIPPNSREAHRASTVRFNCTATGRPEPNITWYKDGKPLQLAGRINLRKSIDGQRTELVISGVTSDDAGVYQCFATNPSSTDSFWAMLNVTGANAEAPANVRCWPLGDKQIRVTWDTYPDDVKVLAYTIHGTSEDEKAGSSLPSQPLDKPEAILEVKTPLIPYRFQVKAYVQKTKSAVSDLSDPAICQGQGIPFRMAKLENNPNEVIVSWKEFAKKTPEVVQWILQTRTETSNEEHNVTLDGSVYNYTLHAPPSQPLEVRVLGTRTLNWLQQDLTFVPWFSTLDALDHLDARDVTIVPEQLEVTDLQPRQFTITWKCTDSNLYHYMVCLKGDDFEQTCKESQETSITFDRLQPGSQYKVLVQARLPHRALGGPFSPPYLINTPMESPLRFRDLSTEYVNSSYILVQWAAAPARYRVHYSAELKLPVEQWASVETDTSSVLWAAAPARYRVHYSAELKLPVEQWASVETDTSSVLWAAAPARYRVHYSAELKLPVEQWASVETDTSSVLWAAAPARYRVHYSAELKLPVEQWASVETDTSSVLWAAAPARYRVHYSAELKLPVEQWASVETDTSSVLWAAAPARYRVHYSAELKLPVEQWASVETDTSSVLWAAAPARYRVHYSAELKLPVEQWASVETDTSSVLWAAAPARYRVHYSAELKLPVEQWASVETDTSSVLWAAAPARYRVHYSAELKLPVEQWASVETDTSSVLWAAAPARYRVHYSAELKLPVEQWASVETDTSSVLWAAAPARYRVHYSAELKLPVEQWASVETDTSSVLVPVIDPSQRTYLMVTSFDPPENSIIQNVPPYKTDDLKLHYEITEAGVRVWWKGNRPRVVSYTQNITAPLDQWKNVTVMDNSVVLRVNLSQPTYVMASEGNMPLTIPPQPARPPQGEGQAQESSTLYLVMGIVAGAIILAILAVSAVCLWRRRKRAQSPVRSRRRHLESNEENAEESEMKAVGGACGAEGACPRGRLANGDARGAGQPLLNGHVHITENPTSKTPNGKMKKSRRYEAAFDVSRYEDPDMTQETVLDADTSTASYSLLDTSRRPEYDRSSREISQNNSFTKLPDDNMNSELTRGSFQLDNSKIQPTLQPNG